MTPPKGLYIRIAPRSSLASKGIDVATGVVNPDYTGEIKVILVNHSKTDFVVTKGQKIAQAILEVVRITPVIEVNSVEETERGNKGCTYMSPRFCRLGWLSMMVCIES